MARPSLTDETREPAPRWSPRLIRTLAEVFATLAPMTEEQALRRAQLAAETLDALPPAGRSRPRGDPPALGEPSAGSTANGLSGHEADRPLPGVCGSWPR